MPNAHLNRGERLVSQRAGRRSDLREGFHLQPKLSPTQPPRTAPVALPRPKNWLTKPWYRPRSWSETRSLTCRGFEHRCEFAKRPICRVPDRNTHYDGRNCKHSPSSAACHESGSKNLHHAGGHGAAEGSEDEKNDTGEHGLSTADDVRESTPEWGKGCIAQQEGTTEPLSIRRTSGSWVRLGKAELMRAAY